MEILYTSKFEKSFQRLPKEIQVLAVEKEKIFRKNMYDPKLRTHRLKGKLHWYFSFSVDYSYRIMFEILDTDDIVFVNVWGHSIYK